MKPSSSANPSKNTKTISRRRTYLFRTVAICIPFLLFGLIELGLRLAGSGYPTDFLVPLDSKPGYLVDNYRFAWRFFPQALARTPQPIVVERPKPKNAFRVVVLGGSAAMGDPEPAYGLPRMLQALLSARLSDRPVEVINCAVTAVNSHVVLEIARDCRQLDADAWVVYLGNNEVHGPFGAGTVFGNREQPRWLSRLIIHLKGTKMGQAAFALRATGASSEVPDAWGGMEMFLDQTIRHSDPALERVYANFEKNLLAIASATDVPVVVGTVASNLKDFPPFVSLHRLAMSEQDQHEWDKAFQAGCQAQAAEKLHEALDAFALAEQLDGSHAELAFRQAQCLLAIGDVSRAADKFASARDHDALRFRADARLNQIIRSHTGRYVLVDAERELNSRSPDGISDNEQFYEHVHLTHTGNYQLARLFADALVAACKLSDATAGRDDGWPTKQELLDTLGVTPFHDRLTLQDVRSRFNGAPFKDQINQRQRGQRIADQLRQLSASLTPERRSATLDHYNALIADRPDDWILKKQLAILLDSMGDLEGATEQYEQITQILPTHAESFFWLGALHNRTKRWGQAEQALRTALDLRPDFARAANSLGICFSHQEKYDESVTQFERAVQQQPTFAEALTNWGLVLAAQGDSAGALQKYREAIAADDRYVPAHRRLGKALVAAEQFDAALPHYEAVTRLLPNDPGAHINLGLLLMRLDDKVAEAKRHFRRALEIAPDNAFAKRALGQLEP